MRRALRLPLALAVGLFSYAQSVSAATIYTFTIIDVPDSTSTALFGINDLGDIVGTYRDATGNHSFVRSGTTYTTLDFPGEAHGINNAGQIVGVTGSGGLTRGFVKDGTTYTLFDVPPQFEFPHSLTIGNGINDAREIVGATDAFSDSIGSFWTYFYPDTQAWGVFAASCCETSQAFGINEAHQIVGFVDYGYLGGTFGYLVDGGNFTTFSAPDAGEFGATWAYGINDAGQIVGSFQSDPFGLPHGFVRNGTTYTQLDVPGAIATWARGINDGGSIVGYFRDTSGATHGFLANPVPEPTSVLLVGTSLVVLLLRNSRGRVRPKLAARRD